MPAIMPPAQPSAVDRLLEVASATADTLATTSSEAPGMKDRRAVANSLVNAARRLSYRGRYVTPAHLDAVLDAATAKYPDAADVALRCDIMVIAAIEAAAAADAADRAADRDRLVESLRAEAAEHRAARDEAERKFAERPSRPRRGFFGGRR